MTYLYIMLMIISHYNLTIPTLDTTLWIESGQVMYKVYEKPNVGNQVLNKDTALPVSSLRASLLQESVRRLQNCSPERDSQIKQDILSRYCKKLINSGHSVKSSRIILVQGGVKYLWKLSCNNLTKDDPKFKPLYLSKEQCEESRQISKYLAKIFWFRKGKRRNGIKEGDKEQKTTMTD